MFEKPSTDAVYVSLVIILLLKGSKAVLTMDAEKVPIMKSTKRTACGSISILWRLF